MSNSIFRVDKICYNCKYLGAIFGSKSIYGIERNYCNYHTHNIGNLLARQVVSTQGTCLHWKPSKKAICSFAIHIWPGRIIYFFYLLRQKLETKLMRNKEK